MSSAMEEMSPATEKTKPVNMVISQTYDKISIRFDQTLNLLVVEPISAIRIGEMLKEKGIEVLRGQS